MAKGLSVCMALVSGAAAGSGLMYYFDPDRGHRRRSLARDRLVHLRHRLRALMGATVADLANRAFGRAAEGRAGIARWAAYERDLDGTIEDRIRSEMGHVIHQPHAVTVAVQDGYATLSGTVPAHEVTSLLGCVRAVPGVARVINELQTPDIVSSEATAAPAA